MKRLLFAVLFAELIFAPRALSQNTDLRATQQTLHECFSSGYVSDTTLFLYANDHYSTLSVSQKSSLLNDYCRTRPQQKITVYTSTQGRELWLRGTDSFILVEGWNNDNLALENFSPLTVQRQGNNRWFFYFGASLSGAKGSSSFFTSARLGTYLYKNYLDISSTLNFGRTHTDGGNTFSGAISASSRAYLPFRIKSANIAPYAGAGFSFNFAPDAFFELQLLTGACWFVGQGSLDVGFQYGTKSKGMLTVGYTFRPSFKKK